MTINSLRKIIYDEILSSRRREGLSKKVSINFTTLKDSDIKLLFDLYDKYFFDNQIMEKINSTGSTIKFTSSNLGGSTFAGKCIKVKNIMRCDYELSFPAKLFLKLFNETSNKKLLANGLVCVDRLSCLQLVFEHELIHLIMNLWEYHDKPGVVYSDHGPFFQCMTKRIFGHTDFKHSLFDEFDEETVITNQDAVIGMNVYFNSHGTKIYGKILKVNLKKAKVQVGDDKVFAVPYIILHKDLTKENSEDDKPSPNIDAKKSFSVGDQVYVKYKMDRLYGQIIKKNSEKALLKLEDGRSMSTPYNILFKSDKKIVVSPVKKDMFEKDQKIWWIGSRGIRYEGIITRMNPLRATITLYTGQTAKVPYDMLHHV